MNARGQPEAQGQDPWKILGLDAGATDEQIRAAYVEKVKEHPPDRSQEQFERIRDAYQELRDPRRRARRMIVSVDPRQPLPTLLDEQSGQRRHVGPEPWLAVLNRR